MTDTQTAPVPALDFTAWDQKEREQIRLADELLPANKTALFDALAAAGIEVVTVIFDSYGDSGQIENIEARAGDAAMALPPHEIEISSPVWGSSEIEGRTQPVREAIETLAYACLGQTHGGWENSDGAYGDFTFDSRRTDHHARLQRAAHGVRLFPARILRRRQWDIAITTPSPR